MLQYERFEAILNKLEGQSSVRVTDLSKELGVSESTIRRDITDLDKAGRLHKVFGGAVPAASTAQGMPSGTAIQETYPENAGQAMFSEEMFGGEQESSSFAETNIADSPAFARRRVNTQSRNLREKEVLQADEKTEVAVRAAGLIREGDLVYIDAGTTTGRMIDHITCSGATFVTNGVRHAIRLAARGFRTYLLSGRVKAKTEAVIGYEAVGSLSKYHFSKCFIGTDGIDEECGLTTADIDESMVKTEAINRSGDVYILADSSKFGLVAAVTFAPLSAGTVITNRLPDPAYRSQVKLIELHE